jgi:uncharacterized protein DUF7019
MPSQPLRDYLYISTRKTERMAPTLRRSWWKRLTGLKAKVGPIDLAVDLSESGGQGVVAAAVKVEEAIRKDYRARSVFAEDVRVGHWVEAVALPMAYGIPVGFGRLAGSAAVFAAGAGNMYVVLSGTAEYLLDRHVEPIDVSQGMSAPQAIGKLLAAAGRERKARGQRIKASPWIEIGYPIHNLLGELSQAGLHPLTFLARVTHVSLSEQGDPKERYIVGTPLYVALDVPD